MVARYPAIASSSVANPTLVESHKKRAFLILRESRHGQHMFNVIAQLRSGRSPIEHDKRDIVRHHPLTGERHGGATHYVISVTVLLGLAVDLAPLPPRLQRLIDTASWHSSCDALT